MVKRLLHLLFKCPTFWHIKPAFTCPICSRTYRCYWDGSDGIMYDGQILLDVCASCALVHTSTGAYHERARGS